MKIIKPKEIRIFAEANGREPFTEWLEFLDNKTRLRIEQRIVRVSLGNYGDYKLLKDSEGVQELRFNFGAGYRVYFAEDGDTIVVLLSGGDKSTQKRDIKKAINYWRVYKEEKND